ncbi:MAG TPA: toll/interleukin-1 receptor domain-containing protein [Candidatus Cybelea sp.]|jgi:hypothetical protein|nr:toll/interleukin-1 receptor domain-containing protein [Candidatus Cybelea sp.]
MTRLFVSYSHVDEAYRKRLGTALALLKRQGLVDVWTDREILPGEEIDPRIAAELDRADVILLLVSPEFIESDYCYEKEMARALERHRAGKAVVIPLILRPCSWKHTSLGGLLAIPRDGTPVSKFADPDDAWHDVETEIRRLIEAPRAKRGGGGSRTPAGTTPPAAPARASAALKLRRSFGDAERDDFIYEAFDTIADSFDASLQALERANADVKARFRRKNAEEFTATVYRDGKERAACRVFRAKQFRSTEIYFSYDAAGAGMQYNESLSAADDGFELRLQPLGMTNFGKGDRGLLTAEEAADYLWRLLLQRLLS